MARMSSLLIWLCAVATFAPCNVARAVDATRISDRYTVVGVISGVKNEKAKASPVGIAVLKDQVTHRSLYLSLGDELPAAPEMKIIGIERNEVVVAGPNGKTILSPAAAPIAKDPPADSYEALLEALAKSAAARASEGDKAKNEAPSTEVPLVTVPFVAPDVSKQNADQAKQTGQTSSEVATPDDSGSWSQGNAFEDDEEDSY